MPPRWRLLFLLVGVTVQAVAQQAVLPDDVQVYPTYIKTVQAYNTLKEQSLPVINLHAREQILFSFDDLEGGTKDYTYVVEHYTADWKPSGLSTLDYVRSFAGDRLQDYEYAAGTLQNYTHYQLKLPNEQVQFKISGNYLLKVYEDGRQKKLIFTQRFFVVDNLANITMGVTHAPDVSQFSTHQKLNFTVNTSRLRIQNPLLDVKTVVLQNGNASTARYNSKPSFIKEGLIQYQDINSAIFEGGNEFRKFDLRNLRAPQQELHDQPRNEQKYTTLFDENGDFYIRNQEGRPAATESDYLKVKLQLEPPAGLEPGDIYVVGRFNQFQTNETSQLRYHADLNKYQISLYLKQGLYDYQYAFKNSRTGELSYRPLEGSFYETRNAYQVFVYYRKPGGRWDELVGYLSTQTDTLPPKQ